MSASCNKKENNGSIHGERMLSLFSSVFNYRFNDNGFSQRYNADRTNGRGESDEGNGAPGQDVQEGQESPGPGETKALDDESGHTRPGVR